MSKNYAFEAEKRDRAGKGIARALRREGKVPAVIYGDKKPPLSVAVPANDINVEYNRGHMYTTLCDMTVDGEKHLVLARDVQLHPVTDQVLHADFLRVTEKTRIPVNVPIQFINENKSPGLKGGGAMNVVRYSVELMCSAMNIPDVLSIDLDGTTVGDTVKISHVTLPEGTTPAIDDRDFSIVSIVAPRKAVTTTSSSDSGDDAEADGDAEDASADSGEEAAEG